MKRLSTFFVAATLAIFAHASVTYQVIPLPRSVNMLPGGNVVLLIKGQGVAYPAENAKMLRNAQSQ